MRARSRVIAWWSYPDIKAARVALAAGTLAGLAVLGACSEGTVTTKVAGPAGPAVSAPVFNGVVGALSHKIQVCVDPFSDPGPGIGGTFSFTIAAMPTGVAPFPWFELKTSSDPDLSGFGITQNSTGPFNAVTDNDVITTNVSVAPGNCADVFVRANTCPGGVCGSDPFDHSGNRLWTDVNGTTNPYASVSITAGAAAGYTQSLTCVNDDINLPQSCVDGGYSSANVFHGSQFVYDFEGQAVNPPLFLILDEDAIDNGLKPNFFKAKDVNDDIAKLGQRKELRWFDLHPGDEIVLWSGQMGDEGWFAPKFIPDSWANAGPTDDGLRNFLGIPVGPGLGKGSNPEALLDKIPDVTPLRAEGLFMLIGRTVCAVVYDSDISINYNPLNGSLKGANLGIVAFTVTNVEQLFGESSGSLPKVTLTVEDADEVCAGDQELFLDAPVPQSSSTVVDIVPNGAG